ncbi:hypothetical protein GN244_ATG08433 [Phytophthora infestans]|nr:hypothetical protein GN244_ATG08433 [Phytophthora infestans]KAF4137360.1 hypothetical protein GN958_ATG13417 [Phytophthora infestans]
MSTRRTNRNAAALAVNANAPADQGVALPPNMALQDDPAVPQVPAPQANVGGAPEPSDESNPAHIGAGGGEEGAEKRTDKIVLRNVKSDTFSGAGSPGAYDSDVQDWWELFADQDEDAQILAARTWLKTYRAAFPSATFEEAGNALEAKFRPNLTDQEISARIYSEDKRASETYQAYADRLVQMAGGLTGGVTQSSNAHHVLGTFLRLTWPQRKDIVEAHIRGKMGTPTEVLNDAVRFLSELSQSDGRLDDYKRRKLTDGSRALKWDAYANPAEASFKGPRLHSKAPRAKSNVAIVERKRKPTKALRRGGVVCFICCEEGHTAKYHRQHLSEDKTETESSRAQGNVAKAEDAVGDSAEDSDEDSA